MLLVELNVINAPSTRDPFSYTEKRVWIEIYLCNDVVGNNITCINKSLPRGGGCFIDDNTPSKNQETIGGELFHFGNTQSPH